MQEDSKLLKMKIRSLKLDILRDTNEHEMDFHIRELSELNKRLEQSKTKL